MGNKNLYKTSSFGVWQHPFGDVLFFTIMSEPKQTPNQAQPQATPQQGNVFEQPTQQAQPQPQPTAHQPQTTAVVPKINYGVDNLKKSLDKPATIESFKKMLGANGANRFISALISIVGNSDELKKADTKSIILAAGQSAALNLPINPSLGLASVIAYWDKKKGPIDPKTGKPIGQHVAQFQIQRNGLMELAQRSGKIAKLVNEIVYEGELKSYNRFTDEYDFSGQRVSDKVIGFMAYAKTTTGFEKTIYMSREEVMAHGQRYSKTFNNQYGMWKTNFEAMALKTVLKKLITKFLPKTEELTLAIESDQASFTSGEIGNATPEYIDNAQSSQTQEPIEVEAIDVENVEAEEV